jgi:putative NADH-flavin reductase
MEQEGVKRIVYLSSIGAGESSAYMGAVARFLITRVMLAVPLADHNANEQLIRNSQLDFTLVRPGSLHDGPFTGKFRHGSEAVSIRGNVKISRADVALFMLQQVTKKDYLMKAAWLFA